MKKTIRYTLFTGLAFALLFCVSASAGITNAPQIVNQAVSEPMNMLLLGFGLIGLGSVIKSRSNGN